MNKEFLNPSDLPNWQQAFSQVVIVKGGTARTIYVAGQVSVDKHKNLIGDGKKEKGRGGRKRKKEGGRGL